jgi:MFS family permease
MDAQYYAVTGKLIASGKGSQEPFIWNYLDDPTGLPHLSFTYWMPLPAIIAAGGMAIFGMTSFIAGRIFFIFISGFLPIITSIIAFRITKRRVDGLLAGFLAIFSGFYIVYLSIPESLSIYLICGGIIFLLLDDLEKIAFEKKTWILKVFLIGVIPGLMHLSRSDGLLWAIGLFIYLIILLMRKKTSILIIIESLLLFLVGYLIIMGPWYIRNLISFGILFPPGNSKTLWITSYNQLFSYPSSLISFFNWWNQNFLSHLKNYWDAFKANLGNLIAVEGLVFLLPFMIIGIVKNAESKITKFFLCMYAVNLIAMTFVFPFAGMRGGFLHSTAAFQPFLWASVPVGLGFLFNRTNKRKSWNVERATRMFYPAIVILTLIITMAIFTTRVVGKDLTSIAWDESEIQIKNIEMELVKLGALRSDVVITNNPPGYYWVTGRSAIAMPDGNITNVVQVAEQYGAKYLIMDKDHVEGLDELYISPANFKNLELLSISNENTQIYKITP